jgi:uncharacterized protein YciI
MHVVFLRFSKNRARAAELMERHREWVDQGFADGIFLVAGSLPASAGGAILAHNVSLARLRSRVRRDPFVVEDVVRAEIIEIKPSRVAKGLVPFLGKR